MVLFSPATHQANPAPTIATIPHWTTWPAVRTLIINATSTPDDQLVVLGEFVEAENGNDVLECLVPLQDLLHLNGRVVVLLAHDSRSEDA